MAAHLRSQRTSSPHRVRRLVLPQAQVPSTQARQAEGQGPAWHRSSHVCWPQGRDFPQVAPQGGTSSPHPAPARPAVLPHGQVCRPARGQAGQGPAWHTNAQVCAPQPKGLPHVLLHDSVPRSQHCTFLKTCAPQRQGRMLDAVHGGQGPCVC